MCEFKVSDKTVELLIKETLKYYEDEEKRLMILEKLRKAGNDAMKIVQTYIDMGWDQISFEMLLDTLEIPLRDKVILFGIAEVKIDEWPT